MLAAWREIFFGTSTRTCKTCSLVAQKLSMETCPCESGLTDCQRCLCSLYWALSVMTFRCIFSTKSLIWPSNSDTRSRLWRRRKIWRNQYVDLWWWKMSIDFSRTKNSFWKIWFILTMYLYCLNRPPRWSLGMSSWKGKKCGIRYTFNAISKRSPHSLRFHNKYLKFKHLPDSSFHFYQAAMNFATQVIPPFTHTFENHFFHSFTTC